MKEVIENTIFGLISHLLPLALVSAHNIRLYPRFTATSAARGHFLYYERSIGQGEGKTTAIKNLKSSTVAAYNGYIIYKNQQD
ncbi:hypothetical protein F5Y15DRAFT_163819 [Xylariaceae sp. FL0016]|nr:hypothetical protein F5Y15DRAFT_163819 [Xylariaceae sp. FL0016]